MEMDPEKFAIGNPFVGDPRAELDNAWDALLQNTQIWVEPSEYAQMQPQLNRTSLRLPDGSYIVRLKAYHELHCLKWIREWIHRDHYWPNITGYELHERRWHIEHCLEEFRTNAMCKPSLAPATFNFVDRSASDDITADGKHVAQCADWEALEAWADKRRVDMNHVDRSTLKTDE
ncbi:hypothetical protein K505DRAFT_312045 [Melanomma pulvis-pyrius CBS 109.77]|uniref:Uncharacterized protein n=1 Tax=Melanomma pulvis-pyrius CBS 109.77 TaxID=1314802 RepID=A0A6A6X1Q3_9PLEO|nr:hypothetical protein K505DRAFT_312045 [Melanomma pulvis-pyrius CBS 109.77]